MDHPRRKNVVPGHVILRPYRLGDGPATHQVFHDAVHQGTGAHYSVYERAAWAACNTPPDDWDDRLLAQNCQVAEVSQRIVGFMSMTNSGHIDMAFVAPLLMGTGVADKLYAKLEAAARDAGLTEMTTDASHLARSFFTRHGWDVLAEQVRLSNGHPIHNAAMRKSLQR